ncbi:KAP family P-loop domain-containing protein [Streptococcus equinus]|uniref:P-loop NTPase fold protein n=1 Tax=Streptococcus equinus TaxID=1335 RepID=UPI0008C8A534|nr:P-loop NTPase fold protein [Streptococcus equinus]SEK72280.1 KAP family P-loop domain-containing protein [Streptococcus equinus]
MNTSIQLKEIDTQIAEENICKLLDENKTYFFNGKWGSGKSSFLEKVEQKSCKKFIIIDLWRIQDSRSIIEYSFSKLYKLRYLCLKCCALGMVAISILMSNVVNLGFSNLNILKNVPFINELGGFIVLLIGIYQFFKIESDDFYVYLFKKWALKNKVLVIDDFDRLSNSQQEQAYKLFSLLEGKCPIIFVGDISKIYRKQDNYLSKIIDRRIELPFVLHPTSIWKEYFDSLEEKFNCQIDINLRKIVEKEQRNLRDRKHFNDYVNKEFFERGKFNHVQINQQLLVIYAYLFHPDYYEMLLNGEIIEYEEKKDSNLRKWSLEGDPIDKQLNDLQTCGSDEYPPYFCKERQNYFLYENTRNRTIEEFLVLVEDNDKLLKELKDSNIGSDFYQYLSSDYRKLDESSKQNLFKISLTLLLDDYSSASINYIIREQLSPIARQEVEKISEKDVCNIFEEYSLDTSEIMFILQKTGIYSIHKIGCIFKDTLSQEIYHIMELKKPAALLLSYLSIKEIYRKFDAWEPKIWKIINNFKDSDFIYFWCSNNIMHNKKPKEYIIWKSTYSSDYINKKVDNTIHIEKILPRLKKLEQKGFTFEFKDDTRFKVDD